MAAPSELIVSVSGIRGIVGEGLSVEAAARFAAAFGSTMNRGHVLISRDSRPSGDMLRHAVIAGLLGTGCTVEDIGIAPTPTCGFAVRFLQTAGAIQITASHNPAPWNGLKMFGADGAVLSAADGAVVRGLYESGEFTQARWDGIGSTRVPPDVPREHLHAVLDRISVARIAGRGYRVFLDANGGAGGPLAVHMLKDLACEVVECGCDPNGVFAHEPEPTPAHLQDVAPWVKQSESAVGFVLDPDADRLSLIDEFGNCVSEEITLALAVKWRLRQASGPVVINMSTSRMVEDIAHAAGSPCYRSAVGEANVVGLMRDVQALIGGEGNGGVIEPLVGWVRDPFVGMAYILSLMAEERKSFSELVKELPKYSMLKTKFRVPREKLPAALDALKAWWVDVKLNTEDGLRIDAADWWLHVRASNTEPVVRVIAEAPTEEHAQQLCDEAGALIRGC